jgi:hypothetical protein
VALSQFGFVPHPAWSGRIGPFPGNRSIWASFRLTASRAFYAVPKHAGSRIQLNFRHLPESHASPASVTIRLTHLAEKPLQMRHKISGYRRNQLKIMS